MDNRIPIASAADQRYFPGLLATIFTSLASAAEPERFQFHIFDGGLLSESRSKIERLVEHFGNTRPIQWMSPEEKQFGSLKSMNGNHLTYARLILPELLSYERILWLDSDLLVLRDCSELWESELSPSLAAAALEDSLFANDVENLCDLGIPLDSLYFNAGVLLMDLEGLRRFDFSRQALDYLKENEGNYKWHDQSAINVILHGKISTLDREFNFLNRIYTESPTRELVEQGNYIYHFLQRPKPWQRYSLEPHAQIFYGIMELLEQSLPELDSLSNNILKLKCRFPRLTSSYYKLTPKRLLQPKLMNMCYDAWMRATEIKSITDSRCFVGVLNKLTHTYKQRPSTEGSI